MRLELVDGGGIIDEPGEAQIIDTLKKVYAQKISAVVLIADLEAGKFMQTPVGGGHIEYTPGKNDPIYAVADIPLEQAIRLFLSYARGDGEWEQMVDWKVYLAEWGTPKKAGNPTLYILLGAALAIVLCGGLIAYQQAFIDSRAAAYEVFLMAIAGVVVGMMLLYLHIYPEEDKRYRAIASTKTLLFCLIYLVFGTVLIADNYHLFCLATFFVWVTGIGVLIHAFRLLRKIAREL